MFAEIQNQQLMLVRLVTITTECHSMESLRNSDSVTGKREGPVTVVKNSCRTGKTKTDKVENSMNNLKTSMTQETVQQAQAGLIF